MASCSTDVTWPGGIGTSTSWYIGLGLMVLERMGCDLQLQLTVLVQLDSTSITIIQVCVGVVVVVLGSCV